MQNLTETNPRATSTKPLRALGVASGIATPLGLLLLFVGMSFAGQVQPSNNAALVLGAVITLFGLLSVVGWMVARVMVTTIRDLLDR